MKKFIYALGLTFFVASGLLFTDCETKNETPKKSNAKSPSVAERNAAMKKWQATTDGLLFKKWEASPEGKKVYASEAKIKKSITDYTNMTGVVTSLSLPPDSNLGFGVMVNIEGDDYILAFGQELSGKNILNFKNEFEQLRTLKVNDQINIKSHSVSHAPKYAYPILSGDIIERDNKIIYKRTPSKDGC